MATGLLRVLSSCIRLDPPKSSEMARISEKEQLRLSAEHAIGKHFFPHRVSNIYLTFPTPAAINKHCVVNYEMTAEKPELGGSRRASQDSGRTPSVESARGSAAVPEKRLETSEEAGTQPFASRVVSVNNQEVSEETTSRRASASSVSAEVASADGLRQTIPASVKEADPDEVLALVETEAALPEVSTLSEAVGLQEVLRPSREEADLPEAIALSQEDADLRLAIALSKEDELREVLLLSREEADLQEAIALSKEEADLQEAIALSIEEADLQEAIALSKEEADVREAVARSLREKAFELLLPYTAQCSVDDTRGRSVTTEQAAVDGQPSEAPEDGREAQMFAYVERNDAFREYLEEHDLDVISNSGRGNNCAIYALVQQIRHDLESTALDQEVEQLRALYDQQHPVDKKRMLHFDTGVGGAADTLIKLVNARYGVNVQVGVVEAGFDEAYPVVSREPMRAPGADTSFTHRFVIWDQQGHYEAVTARAT